MLHNEGCSARSIVRSSDGAISEASSFGSQPCAGVRTGESLSREPATFTSGIGRPPHLSEAPPSDRRLLRRDELSPEYGAGFGTCPLTCPPCPPTNAPIPTTMPVTPKAMSKRFSEGWRTEGSDRWSPTTTTSVAPPPPVNQSGQLPANFSRHDGTADLSRELAMLPRDGALGTAGFMFTVVPVLGGRWEPSPWGARGGRS